MANKTAKKGAFSAYIQIYQKLLDPRWLTFGNLPAMVAFMDLH